jgi:hypothetical protein
MLAASLLAAAFIGYHAWNVHPPAPAPRGWCWTRGADFAGALYQAARCRFGAAHVDRLGWMPYLGALNDTLEEVAVLDPLGHATFWVARYHRPTGGSVIEVRTWTPCPASNIYC